MNEAVDQGLVAVPKQSDAMVIFSVADASGVDPLLAMIRARIDAFVAPDLKTAKGRKEIASFAHKIAQSKTALEEVGKALADEAKSIPKKIDASRKKVRDTLDQWRDEVRAPLDKWEADEEARVANHTSSIETIRNRIQSANHSNLTLEMLRAMLAVTETVEIGKCCEEFEDEYRMAKTSAIAALSGAIGLREKYEADQAELAKLRAEADARAAKDRAEAEAKAAAEAAQKAQEAREREETQRTAAEAERQRVAVEAAAKAERDAAERREIELRQQAERAERLAAETEARIKREAKEAADRAAAETAAREADKAHKTKVNRAAVVALVGGGVPEDVARTVVTLIAKRSIPAVTISY